ncbi:hypothetical protein BDA96_03G017200 [Sorghum bicolor]|uniref:Uncharacterized protein n=2 Tax=Sorghum bicolor TaxID=4558 RepID=A0A921R8X3_SORBI|nr:hypothetical protein BDA96_03G017200 [Sorghum bicolor]KXG31542.1 hypothetical protein SORBI_3003G015500 [Sorghum bicolor]
MPLPAHGLPRARMARPVSILPPLLPLSLSPVGIRPATLIPGGAGHAALDRKIMHGNGIACRVLLHAAATLAGDAG